MEIQQNLASEKPANLGIMPDLRGESPAGLNTKSFYIINILIALALLAKVICFQYETGLSHGTLFSYGNISMLVCSILLISAFAALCNLLAKGKKAIFIFLVIDLLLSILLLADINSMRYYYKPLSIFLLYDVDFKFFSAVSNAIDTIYKPLDIIFFVDLPFLLGAILLIPGRNIKASATFRKRTVIVLISSLILLFFTASVTSQSRTSSPDSANYTARNAGIFTSHLENLYELFTKKILPHGQLTNEETLAFDNYIKENKSKQTGTELSGAYKGKNLIMIQVEALQNFLIGLKVNGKEVTPNLNRLAAGSCYFNNMFYQVSFGNTSDAEFLSNTSMYPLRSASVYYAYANNKFPSLPALLKQNGYDTSSFHPFDPHFWNRDTMYKTLGFNRFYSEADYKMDDFAGWEGNALSDRSFFKQSLDKMAKKEPFYSLLITLSSHFPFSGFENSKFDTGLPDGNFISNYLKAENYTDECIGQFMKDLEERGLLENSIVVLYGDHSAIPKYKASELMGLLGKDYCEAQWTELQKIPCIIHLPDQKEGKTISSVCGQIDIYPTIANLLGFKPFTIGRDLFNTIEHFAILQDCSVITDSYIYQSASGKVYDSKDFHELPLDDYMNEIKKMQNELEMSDLIITKDAFKNGLP